MNELFEATTLKNIYSLIVILEELFMYEVICEKITNLNECDNV